MQKNNLKDKSNQTNTFTLYRHDDLLMKEKERIIIRWIITAIIIYMFFSSKEHDKWIMVGSIYMTIAYFVINTVRYFLINNESTLKYQSIFLYLDIIMVTTTLIVLPEKGAFFHPVLLFLIISTGLNYGHKLMLKCNTFVIFLFTFTVITNSYWQENMSTTLSVYLMMLLIPFYLIPIIKNLELNAISLSEKAYKDHLTGLHNRMSIFQKLENVIKYSRANKSMFGIFYFDLDNFKKVNDQLGHKAGDSLLIAVSNNLQSSFRNKDLIFRVGGDEFILLADSLWSKDDAIIIAQKILLAVSNASEMNNPEIKVTASIGIVCMKADSITQETDIKKYITISDKAMYNAKKSGKSKYMFANFKKENDGIN
jgi:diguanylate cyclase (GGDEF)-like protein